MAGTTTKKSDNRTSGIKGVTPAGEAVYPKLIVPDTKFDPDGTYSIKLRLPDGQEADSLIAKIDAVREQAYQDAVADAPNPVAAKRVKRAEPSYSRELDNQTGEETGNWLFNFKMKASGTSKRTGKFWTRKPGLFDAQGTPITKFSSNDDIWSGSLVKIAYELRPYNSPSFGAGCTQALEAVQVLKLVKGNARSADDFGFGVEEGYAVAEGTPFDGDTPFDVEAPKSDENGDVDF